MNLNFCKTQLSSHSYLFLLKLTTKKNFYIYAAFLTFRYIKLFIYDIVQK